MANENNNTLSSNSTSGASAKASARKEDIINSLSGNPAVLDLIQSAIIDQTSGSVKKAETTGDGLLEGFLKVQISSDLVDRKSISDPYNISFTKILVPNIANEFVTINRPGVGYISRLLAKKAVRDVIISFISDIGKIKSVFTDALHSSNAVVYIGSITTSYTSIRAAITKNFPDIKADSDEAIVLCYLVQNYFQSYGLVLHEPEVYAFISLSNEDSVDSYMKDVILNSYVDIAAKAIPEKGSIKSNRSNIYELANEFNIIHSSFRHRLADFDYFETAYKSVLTRIHSFMTLTGQKIFGDDFMTALDSPAMMSLLSIGNMIDSAMNIDSTDIQVSPARLWNLEDERVLRGIEYLVSKQYVKEITKLDFMKRFSAKVVYAHTKDDYEAKKIIMLSQDYDSNVTNGVYRVYNYDDTQLHSFIQDNRYVGVDSMVAALKNLNFESIIETVLRHTVKPLSDRFIIYRGVEDSDKRLLAMCLADNVSVDRKAMGKLFYDFKVELEDIRSGMIDYAVNDIARTNSVDFIIFNRINDDMKASSFINEKYKAFNIRENTIYAIDYRNGKCKDLFNVIDAGSIITISTGIYDKTVNLKYPVVERMFEKTTASLVQIRDPYVKERAEIFFKNLQRLLDSSCYTSDNNTKSLIYIVLLDVITQLSSSVAQLDGISYNLLWNYAKRNNMLRKDMVNDILFRLSIRQISMSIASYFIGIDTSSIWSAFKDRQLELARNLSLVK